MKPDRVRMFTCLVITVVAAGCSSTPLAPPSGGADAPVAACPDSIQNDVMVRASITPRDVPKELAVTEGGVQRAYAVLGRRVLVSVVPTGSARQLKILDSSLSITPYGGTFESWAALDGAKAGVDVEPGRLRVTSFLQPGALHAQTLTLDSVIRAGGAPVDQMAVTTGAKWNADQRPTAPDALQVTLIPLRHFTAYDVVEAKLTFDFSTQASRKQPQWKCSVQTRATLVDRDAARPPLWDVGTSHRGGGRKLWLALYDPKLGPTRALFTSPMEAQGFADWIQQTSATHAATYQLGVFTPEDEDEDPATLPADRGIMETYHAITAEERAELKVGQLNSP